MATIEQLIERNALTRVEVTLDGGLQPWRTLLVFGRLVNWLRDELPDLESDRGDLSPLQQLDALLADYISGEPLEINQHLHVLKPSRNGVWEFRSVDLRLFGWFYTKNIFIGSSAGMKNQIQRHGLYPKYRDQAASDRDTLDLNEPKSINGLRYHDILSDRHQ